MMEQSRVPMGAACHHFAAYLSHFAGEENTKYPLLGVQGLRFLLDRADELRLVGRGNGEMEQTARR